MYRSTKGALPTGQTSCVQQHTGTRASSSHFPCPRVTTACAQPLAPALGTLGHGSYLMSRPLRNRILSPALRAAFSAGLPKGTRTKGLQLQHLWLEGGSRDTPRQGTRCTWVIWVGWDCSPSWVQHPACTGSTGVISGQSLNTHFPLFKRRSG